ncbi:MAG: TonB-dependent receptor [Anaeromyxobacter sp.]
MIPFKPLGAAAGLLAPFLALAQPAQADPQPAPDEPVVLDEQEIVLPPAVTGATGSTLGAAGRGARELDARRPATVDAAELLRGVPGVTLGGAGGISSLPAIHGLSDDRVRVQVDGADLVPACPNHMNSPLSYADPSRVASVTVYSGITPVSVGGDSIGGSIQVRSAPPLFANGPDAWVARGRAGGWVRSNGAARGFDLGATGALRWLSLDVGVSDAWSGDLRAGGAFKPAAPGREGGPVIPADVIASSAYRGTLKRAVRLALRRPGHLLQLEASRETVGFEGFPNQRMDMTDNDNRSFTARYTAAHEWGDLEASAGYQRTLHEMDMGPARFSYGTGMPMDTTARTWNAAVRANLILPADHLLRAGVEGQRHTIYDSWPPVGGTMGPNTFWNVDYGVRERLDLFAEWEARWSERWTTQAGVRGDAVRTAAGPVQGYDNGLPAVWGDDAARFNAARRRRADRNLDATLSARFTPSPAQAYEAGLARKTRSPNLYERYAWSTNAMAALMNNFVGDGNGYVGDVDLAPETAYTASATADWHDAARARWSARAAAHVTRVHGYVDARRCGLGQCSASNAAATTGFVLLQYANHEARLAGADLAADAVLVEAGRLGRLSAAGTLSWVRGENLTTGDGLYGIAPLGGTLSVVHRAGPYTTTAELVAAGDKTRVSRVRNEVRTGGYAVVNLRASAELEHLRVDLSVENALDRLHANPLGGAYVGQGASMSTGGVPWGTPVPGPGRSFNAALTVRY